MMNYLDIEKKRKNLGMTQTELAKLLGISLRTVQNYEKGAKIPETKHEILRKFISGELVGTQTAQVNNEAERLEEFKLRYVPVVTQYAYAGYLTGYGDEEFIEGLPHTPFVMEHEGKGNYMVFLVKGDSMSDGSQDSILEGDELLCREIQPHLWMNSRLHLKRWANYVIVHRTEGILIKQIVEHDVERGTIKIHSLNPEFEDRTIELNEVAQLFNVVKAGRNMK